ncbi:MAG: hypothetical protein IPP18_14675 [Rhodocyclaceae bacterium]|nr:hypothetical protein [Rhodocyclaceae bacterium]
MAIKIPTLPEQLPTAAPFRGQEIQARRGPGLVAGTAAFIDNLSLPGMLHCAILRSPHPHARVVKVDVRAAEALPGVFAVLTGEDVRRWANPAYTAPEGWGGYCIAVDKVRFVGEPVAAVAAVSRYVAEDALELIEVEYDVLKPVPTPAVAMAADAPILFEEQGGNVIQSRVLQLGRCRSRVCRGRSCRRQHLSLEPGRRQPNRDFRLYLPMGYRR